MNTLGDSAEWDEVFGPDLVPDIMAHVSATWAAMEKPAPDDWEKDISLKLYANLVNAKDRDKHPFLIRYEDVELDFDLGIETGRKDIVFFPGNREAIYFCLEAKRLNAMISGRCTSLADEYVKEGMMRFVTGKYSCRVKHGGMLAYVLDGDVERGMKNVGNNIESEAVALCMQTPVELKPSAALKDDGRARDTHHIRAHDGSLFRIHHLFLGGDSSRPLRRPNWEKDKSTKKRTRRKASKK